MFRVSRLVLSLPFGFDAIHSALCLQNPPCVIGVNNRLPEMSRKIQVSQVLLDEEITISKWIPKWHHCVCNAHKPTIFPVFSRMIAWAEQSLMQSWYYICATVEFLRPSTWKTPQTVPLIRAHAVPVTVTKTWQNITKTLLANPFFSLFSGQS